MNESTPTVYQRDSRGLVSGYEYVYEDNGLINWKAMIPSKYLGIKKDKIDDVVRKYCKDGVTLDSLDLSKVEDYFLYIKKGGMTFLARLRGYSSLIQTVPYVSDTKAVAVCTMTFVPNFETDMQPLVCSDMANGSLYNVPSGFESYIETFAANRSFSRCVRLALGINVVTEEELGANGRKQELPSAPSKNPVNDSDIPTPATSFEAWALVESKCKDRKITFENLKKASKGQFEIDKNLFLSDPDTWTTFSDIKPKDAWSILGKMESTSTVKKIK